MLVLVLTAMTSRFTAEQVMVASSKYENVNCVNLNNELGKAQARL